MSVLGLEEELLVERNNPTCLSLLNSFLIFLQKSTNDKTHGMG
jgi:hypothetical protein